MSISIALDGDQVLEQIIFHPGDTIRGKVIYEVSKPQTINKATIEFCGTIRTEWIPLQQGNMVFVQGPRRPSKERIVLFEQQVALFEGPYKVPPQTFEWPFEVTLPRTCSRAPPSRSDTAPIRGMPPDGAEIPLPPDYKWRHMLIGRDASAEIKYSITVAVSNGSRLGGIFNDDKKEYLVSVRHRRASSSSSLARGMDLKPSKYQFTPGVAWTSNTLRPAERRLSLRDKMRSSFSSDPTLKPPCLAFKTAVHIPCILDLHQRFSVGFSLLHERKTEYDPESPTLELTNLLLILKTHTTMVISQKGFFQEERFAQGEGSLASYTVPLPSEGIPLPLGGEMICAAEDLCLADWPEADRTDPQEPTLADFATWVLMLRHRLSIQATIRHAESGKDFRLASQISLELTTSDPAASEGVPAALHESMYEDLPRYGDDVEPPSAAAH